MEFLRGLGRVACLVLVLAVQSGCVGYPPPASGEETSSSSGRGEGETGSSEVGSTGALDTSGSETGSTGIALDCGNGVIDADETCEATDLAGETCEGLGFGVGRLACNDACGYETSGCTPAMPVLSLGFSPIKRFDFSWDAVQGAEHYRVLESPAPGEPYVPLGEDVSGESVSFVVPLHLRWEASYMLQACSAGGCTTSASVEVMGSLVEAVGYVKASNTGASDTFGVGVALSGDGSTLAVGASGESSGAMGIGGVQTDNGAVNSGAVYVFVRDAGGVWSQEAYIKPFNTGAGDAFGGNVALSGDGDTLAVSAFGEDSTSTGIGGLDNDDATLSGAVYVFVRSGAGAWSQQAYVKASNTGVFDQFGYDVALSGDGDTLAVGAPGEDSNATGIGGDQANDNAVTSGAVYVFVRDGAGSWSQQIYVKALNATTNAGFGHGVALSGDGDTLAVSTPYEQGFGGAYVFVRDGAGSWSQQVYIRGSNTEEGDWFGYSVALSADGDTLAVGARHESSQAHGIGGDPIDNSASASGAVYVFMRNVEGAWSQKAYVKASNTGANDLFGCSVALSGDGSILAVGALFEGSSATGLQGNEDDDSAGISGAAYVFGRDGAGAWSQQAYVKASNTEYADDFGVSVALSGDGNTLAVGADGEDSSAMGIGNDQSNGDAPLSGAVYLY